MITTRWITALRRRAATPGLSSPLFEEREEGRPPRALIVDDSEVARRALANALAAAGFGVTEAGLAREAERLLARCGAGEFDVILMDLHLPDGSGIDACARIKSRPDWHDVPVIVVTGSDDDRDLTLAYAAGATDYITKPPRDFELLARVRAALRLKEEMTRRRAREAELERLNARLHEQALELAAAKTALQELNDDLERRVHSQVIEIVTRAREVEELNAQLRAQVSGRSRDLAEALRRLSCPPGHRRRTFAPGKVIGQRVKIVRHLADGGMGVVYLGRDLATGTAVAVKLLDSRVGSTEKHLQRFINEAAASAAIAHPAVVKTIHVDVTRDGDLFLMMELVDGVTLERILAKGALPPLWAPRIGQVVAEALAAAHAVNVVHRDMKPANLMISRAAPGVRVLDFGISKIRPWADGVTATQTAELLGTPAYMAPEQLEDAAAVTAATDVYGLGAVMFEMVTGTRPFRDLKSRLRRDSEGPPPVATLAPEIPPALAAIVDRCLARIPARRPTALELSRDLAALATALQAPPAQQLLQVLERRAALPAPEAGERA